MPDTASDTALDTGLDTGLDTALAERVSAVRGFSRFYTRQIGLLQDSFLRSRFSLTEGRVLYELAHRDGLTATALGAALGLDAGYLSRILSRFADDGLVAKARAKTDARQSLLSLTAKGRKAFAPLNRRSQEEVAAMLGALAPDAQSRVVAAMETIENLLRREATTEPAFTLRPHRPGDMGFVVASHGAIYAREYDWDISFEGLVAEIVAQFLKNYDPAREQCWIAEVNGEPVGSVFVVKASDEIAKLRLLILTPAARGLGIGRALVAECVAFARARGYKTMTLWTQSILTAARAIYQDAGFRLVATEPHHSFGHDLVGETWELAL
jgi:DNA-binding MarR family transcriptional regulator/GNAT superfamily N-acetyltransferase